MTQMSPMQPYDELIETIEDYRLQSRDFLAKSRTYLADDDLHQASEKGWGAAAWMTKAVAVAQGWQYDKHEHFGEVLYQAGKLTGEQRLNDLRKTANDLHGNFYQRKRFLHADLIAASLDEVATLLNMLEPLTER
ncbi:MAG: hypothetical protein OXL37_11995 [Chloroflexota bacterium]|nr:hypothetical protein [Chloroflexota bacterium]MDE2962163.1 hypothetical protein [Chloroflexota bacterium]